MRYGGTGKQQFKGFSHSHCHSDLVFGGECNRERGAVLAYCPKRVPFHDGRGILSVAGSVAAFVQKNDQDPAHRRHRRAWGSVCLASYDLSADSVYRLLCGVPGYPGKMAEGGAGKTCGTLLGLLFRVNCNHSGILPFVFGRAWQDWDPANMGIGQRRGAYGASD